MDVFIRVKFTPRSKGGSQNVGAIRKLRGLKLVDGPPGLEGVAPRIASIFVSETTIHVEIVSWS
jgi:hypothetical protein